jgi:hypothetical protein
MSRLASAALQDPGAPGFARSPTPFRALAHAARTLRPVTSVSRLALKKDAQRAARAASIAARIAWIPLVIRSSLVA